MNVQNRQVHTCTIYILSFNGYLHIHICLRHMLHVQHVVKLCIFVSVHV